MITTNSLTLRNPSMDFTGTQEELKELISVLEFELKSHTTKGFGLSAIQINIPLRVAIVRCGPTSINLYNAKIINKSQPFVYKGEGCLSIPDVYLNTDRYNQVEILNGDGEIIKLSGTVAVVCQHEIEHFDGILFTDNWGKV